MFTMVTHLQICRFTKTKHINAIEKIFKDDNLLDTFILFL